MNENITPQRIIDKLWRVDEELAQYCDDLDTKSIELVNAETKYDMELSSELVRMKAKGDPATTAEKIAKGQPHIIACSLQSKGLKEQVNNLKSRIKSWQSRLTVGQSLLKSVNDEIKYNNIKR